MAKNPTYEELAKRIQQLERVDSKREQAEKTLRESEKKYRHLVEHAPTGIYIIDFLHDKLVSINDAMVITDMAMPDMTGDKLIEENLKIRSDIRVVLCTGFSEKIDESSAKTIGAADYIEKPIDKRNFAFKMRSVLDDAKE